MPDRLRPLWDFSDLDASERRFRAALGEEPSAAGRAEILTQLAALSESLELIDHKIDVYRGRLEAGDADRLWVPTADS